MYDVGWGRLCFWRRAPSPWLAILPMFFLSMCSYLSMPSQQEQIIQLVCADVGGSCDSTDVSSKASIFVEWSNLVGALISLFVVGVLGGVADAHGRLVVLIYNTAGIVLQFVINALVATIPSVASAWRPWLIAGYVAYGLSGGFSVALFALFAYCADCTPSGRRGVVFTVLEASRGLGAVLGQAGAGFVSERWGLAAGFYLGIAGGVIGILYLAALRESLAQENRLSKLDWRRANTISAMRCLFVAAPADAPKRQLAGKHVTGYLAMSFILAILAFLGSLQVMVLYVVRLFAWSDDTVGYFMSTSSGCSASFGILFAYMLEPKIRGERDECWIVQGFFVLGGAFFATMGFVRSPALMFVASAGLGISLAAPYGFLRGLISKGVGASMQGQTLAGICAVQTVMSLLAPVLFNGLYAATVTWSPGITLVLMAVLSVSAALVILPVTRLAKADGEPLILKVSE